MGGGDGKVDTKTYPVADAVSDGRWIAAPRGDDRWAFAFSAMKDWKRKVRSDVVKIAETDRGYCRRNSEHERRLSRVAHLSARRSGQGGAHQRLVEAGSVVLTSVMGAAATPPNSGRSEGRRRVRSSHCRPALPCPSSPIIGRAGPAMAPRCQSVTTTVTTARIAKGPPESDPSNQPFPLGKMVGATGFEPATP